MGRDWILEFGVLVLVYDGMKETRVSQGQWTVRAEDQPAKLIGTGTEPRRMK